MEELKMDDLMVSTSEKLTKWKSEPTYKDLYSDYEEAVASFKNHKAKIEQWERDRSGGKQIKQIDKRRSTVRPLLIRKQNEWRYPSLEEPFLSTDNIFKILPRTAEDVEAAKQNEIILNYQIDVLLNKPKFIGELVRTLVDDGTAIAKVGWDVEYETVEEMVEEAVYATPQESLQIINSKYKNGEISAEEAKAMIESAQPVQIGTKQIKVQKEKLVKNQPKIEIRDTKHVIIDPTCDGDMDKALFVIDEYSTNMAELKRHEYKKVKYTEKSVSATGEIVEVEVVREEGLYRNLDKVQLNNEEYNEYKDKDVQFKFSDKNKQKIKAYDYWGYWDIHKNGKLVPIIATWVGNTLIRLEENPFPFKKPPYAVVPYILKKGSIYGEADAELLRDNQDIIGKLTRAGLDIIGAQATGQKFIHSSILKDPSAKANYEAGKDVIYNAQVHPKDAIYVTNAEAPSPVIYNMIGMYQQEAESLTGIKGFNSGINGDALGSTATSVRSAMDATSKRELSILRRVNSMLTDIARMIIDMNKTFLDDETIIRVTNDEHITIKRDELAGVFDLKVEISTAERDNERAQELSFMLQTLGNSVDPMTSATIMAKIARLRKMPDLAEAVIENAKQAMQPDPIEQQMKQIEVARAKLELAQLQKDMEEADSRIIERLSRSTENEEDKAMKKAKAYKEAIAAKKIESEKDKIDYDVMEKASGLDTEKKMMEVNHSKDVDGLIKENEQLKQLLAELKNRVQQGAIQ